MGSFRQTQNGPKTRQGNLCLEAAFSYPTVQPAVELVQSMSKSCRTKPCHLYYLSSDLWSRFVLRRSHNKTTRTQRGPPLSAVPPPSVPRHVRSLPQPVNRLHLLHDRSSIRFVPRVLASPNRCCLFSPE